MSTPRESIHTRRIKLAGILIAIASPENPVSAIVTPYDCCGHTSCDGKSTHSFWIRIINQQGHSVAARLPSINMTLTNWVRWLAKLRMDHPMSIFACPNDYLTRQPMAHSGKLKADSLWLMSHTRNMSTIGGEHGKETAEAKDKQLEDAGQYLLVRSTRR
jgi:hypothetical protein